MRASNWFDGRHVHIVNSDDFAGVRAELLLEASTNTDATTKAYIVRDEFGQVR